MIYKQIERMLNSRRNDIQRKLKIRGKKNILMTNKVNSFLCK